LCSNACSNPGGMRRHIASADTADVDVDNQSVPTARAVFDRHGWEADSLG
jgi:hypothetical protein